MSAWCAGKSEDCFLQVNLGSLHLLCAVATQGNPGGNRDFVKRYKLMSSTDGENWSTYEENGNNIIEGNTDNWSVKKKELEQEIITRYVRICPVDWYCWPCLRVELYGAALNIGDKFPSVQSEDGGSYVVEKVLVTTYETHVDENGVPAEDSLKEQEKKIIREAKERQRIEEEQQNRLEEIQIFIEQEEVKRKPPGEDMDDNERKEAEARIQLVLAEERALERREKPDGEDVPHRDIEEEKHDRVTMEYNRIDEEHRRRMEALTAILGEDEERRKKEKEERRKAEEDARKKREEERRAKEEEVKRKREEERRKWEEEHRRWEEERKKRDRELEAVLEEGRKKRAEERQKRDEELRKAREEERRKREEERRKRLEEEMKKLEDLKREREERWNKKTEVVISGVDLSVQTEKGEEDTKTRQDEKKKKEEGWMKRVETPRAVEEEMKKFRDEERKRLEEERKKLAEKEIAEAEAEKEFKSEIRVLRQEKPETITKVSVATIQLATAPDIGEEKRRIEWRMQKIEQDRLLREEEERKRREEAERKRKEDEERAKEEAERRRREQEEERERRKEELRLKKEAEERQKREEEERKRQEEDTRRRMTLEERRKRLEEDRKKREEEERIWRREMEERKQREEEEKRKQVESKKLKRLSIERKKFEEEEKKRLDAIEHKRLDEEEKERLAEEQRRREERERWKMKQVERRRSGEIYRNNSEQDLRQREERYSFKEKQRKQRDSKSFETKWEFINGERVEVPVDESFVSAVSVESYSEPPEVFDDETPGTRYVTVNSVETKRTPSTEEKDSPRTTSTIRVISTTTTTTRTRYYDPKDKHPRHDSEETSLNGEVMPYRSQPHCDHLLPTDPSVQEASEMSFFDKFEEGEGKLRPFPSWYGGLDMGSLPHLYLPANPIKDSDIDLLLSIENEGLKSWKRVKKSGELEIYSRKGMERGSPPVTKAVMVLKDIPYRDAIDLVSDWDERSKWDKTFDGVSFLDQMADFKLLKCSQKKKNRCAVLASLDREDEEPYYAWAWKGSNHPSVPGEDTKLTVMRLETGICGAIIRPYHDATRSCKITIITQVRGSVPSPLKSTYLTGNPSKWLLWMKKHHNSQLKSTLEKEQDDDKNKDDASSVSSKSDKQDSAV
ncbi:hypothetical protein ACROYT_G016697 [Oculina patagonica]